VPAAERLSAFAVAYLRYVDAHLDLVAMSQQASPGARLRIGAHRFWTQHCRLLLTEAGAADPQLRADTLLAALSAEQVGHWRRDQNRSLASIAAGVTRLCGVLTT
jgi:hypothetical protein